MKGTSEHNTVHWQQRSDANMGDIIYKSYAPFEYIKLNKSPQNCTQRD